LGEKKTLQVYKNKNHFSRYIYTKYNIDLLKKNTEIIYKNRTNANQIVGGIPIKSVIKCPGYIASNSAVLAQHQQITCAFAR